MNTSVSEKIRETVRQRAFALCNELKQAIAMKDPLQCSAFYMAGGCLCSDPVNDIDLFPSSGEQVPQMMIKPVFQSKNADTYATKPHPTQVCNYAKSSLVDLIMSFDFAHIQVGAKILVEHGELEVSQIEFTDEFVAAEATRQTWFTGTSYPLSSLLRAAKYYNRGRMTRSKYINNMLSILNSVISRGFDDYADFKDQIDAVDLGLLPENLSDVQQDTLRSLFEKLCRRTA